MPDDLSGASLDLARLSDDLMRLLRLRNAPFGMKMFEDAAEMEAIPRIRRPDKVHTLREGLADYYHRKEYLRCESMGALIRENLESIRRDIGRPVMPELVPG